MSQLILELPENLVTTTNTMIRLNSGINENKITEIEPRKIIISKFYNPADRNINLMVMNVRGPNFVQPINNLIVYTKENGKIIEKNDESI